MAQSDLVYETLNAAILGGRIPPGTKLSEPAIAEEIGVSRAPVREAIRRLQERGVVSHSPNLGARVIAPTIDEFLALLDVREALESMACRLAATEMGDAALESLADLVRAHGETLQQDPAGPYLQVDRDTDFHVRIAIGSGNPVLRHLLCEDFYPRLKLCRMQHRSLKGRGIEAWREHGRILEALLQRDGELAEMMMRRHVRSARNALLRAQETG